MPGTGHPYGPGKEHLLGRSHTAPVFAATLPAVPCSLARNARGVEHLCGAGGGCSSPSVPCTGFSSTGAPRDCRSSAPSWPWLSHKQPGASPAGLLRLPQPLPAPDTQTLPGGSRPGGAVPVRCRGGAGRGRSFRPFPCAWAPPGPRAHRETGPGNGGHGASPEALSKRGSRGAMGPGGRRRAEDGEDQWDVGVSQEAQRLPNGRKREPGGVRHRPAAVSPLQQPTKSLPPYCPWLQLAAGAPLCFPEPFLCGVEPGTVTDSSVLPAQAAVPEGKVRVGARGISQLLGISSNWISPCAEDEGSGADLLSELTGHSEGRSPGNNNGK